MEKTYMDYALEAVKKLAELRQRDPGLDHLATTTEHTATFVHLHEGELEIHVCAKSNKQHIDMINLTADSESK